MAEAKSWAEVAQSESQRRTQGGIDNMKLVSGHDFNVRFVGDPVKFQKYFINNKSAITDGGEQCIIRTKYNIEPSTRYAVNVIDRSDGKLKVLEIAPSVLKPVIAWWKARKHDPGGDNGCDFNIDVTGQKKNTRYNVTPLDITPFTDEEKSMIESGAKDLRKLYKPVPQNEIEGRLFGGATGASQPNSPTTQTVAANGGSKPGWEQPPF